MATLVRQRSAPASSSILAATVPSPFPTELLQQERETEILPSIAVLQRSCILTLNTLLAGSEQWKTIVPERRHSIPGPSSGEPESSALETLVANLRTLQDPPEALPGHGLASELQERVRGLAPALPPHDAALATSLATLLAYFGRLSSLPASASSSSYAPPIPPPDTPPPIDMYDALSRQLNDLQLERLSTHSSSAAASLLWSQIDRELETIVAMCQERTDRLVLPRFYPETHPPQYDYDCPGLYDFESPPEYDGTGRASLDKPSDIKVSPPTAPSRMTDEAMRLDLEGIAMAIDRLYLVAPQLHNQRVELKSSKLAQLERARKQGSVSSSRKGKDRDRQELENIIDLLGKASERTLKDQSVLLEDGMMHSRLEKAKRKDLAKRNAFVEELIKHSVAGRMHGQDAIPSRLRIKDPLAKLTFPEFIREAIPPNSELLHDPSVMLTLPEFVAQHPPEDQSMPDHDCEKELKKKSRNRSLSAPPLAWLRNATKSNSGSGASSPKQKRPDSAFDVVYVAENHEHLYHVLVFLTVIGQTPNTDLTAEILPPFPEHVSGGGDYLVVKSRSRTSLPLVLPARTSPGKKEVQAQGSHFQVKLGTLPQVSRSRRVDEEEEDVEDDSDGFGLPLLDAAKLSTADPSSFTCASCSLPLIQTVGRTKMEYRDLPSEHWEELVEAWMCHSDQKLHDQAMKHGRAGFWPVRGQAFVGGSYLLFEESVMVNQNMLLPMDDKHDDDWKVRRCLCGAIIGRSQTKPHNDAETTPTTTCFRVLKYAIRPVTLTFPESLKIPLSAFIVEDMMEYVQAHASYRFVIRDEEDEKPRILIWLFKPKMRLSYTISRARAIPKSGCITAAKVLYKLIGPSEATVELKTFLDKYPGFSQAEYLSYPMSICRRVAVLLKESNTAYPERMRTMMGLEVGWLHRR